MVMGQQGFPTYPDDQPPGSGRCGCHDLVPGDHVEGQGALPSERVTGDRREQRAGPAGIPFVVQAGSALYMVASEARFWTLAELRFDSAACAFVEASRARFDWPREAFGAMLSRVAVSGEIEPGLINRVTMDFSAWLAQQFVLPRAD